METPPPPAVENLNLIGVLSESKRIINAHSRHFLALSVLFLLPLSFSLIIYPTLSSALFHHSNLITTQFFSTFSPTTTAADDYHHLLLPFIYTLLVSVLSLCALATITYSTFHGFFGRPVKLLAAVKSLIYSFLPLISTTLAAQLCLLLISLVPVLFVGVFIKGIEVLGFEIDYDSNIMKAAYLILLVVIGLIFVYFQVIWTLAPVIVVAESKWGFEPLWRSAKLVKGMRSVSLSLLLFFGILTGSLGWGNSNTVLSTSSIGWRRWAFVFQIVLGSSFVTLLLLHNTASNTVLYMYCKALHGELAFEIAEEFAREYVSLPFDDQKVPHVVTVV